MTIERSSQNETCFCVDMGTTNTRVWLLHAGDVVARETALFGVRNSASLGSTAQVQVELRTLLESVSSQVPGGMSPARAILSAGMITSSSGLEEVPHILAPAGQKELTAGVRVIERPEIGELPILLVPGIKTVFAAAKRAKTAHSDVMRGEETLCVGLIAAGKLVPGGTLLNLGSHWKAIRTDASNRVLSSVTTLSGELIHAVQSQTILAGSLPRGKFENSDLDWLEAGMAEQRKSGLARALFCVRLLDQQGETTAEQRKAFLVGACIASDLDPWVKTGVFQSPVLITGSGGLPNAWRWALHQQSIDAVICSADEIEAAFLRGLQTICRPILASMLRE